MNSIQLLHRYWFSITKGLGIGVTAFTASEARKMAEEVLPISYPNAQLTTVIEDVDIRTLDQKHVVPNIGSVAMHGVWFPRLNV
jgi:hypothetical protein